MKILSNPSTAELTRREFPEAAGLTGLALLAPGCAAPRPAARGAATRRRLASFYKVGVALGKGAKVTRGVVRNHRRSREFVREIFKA